MASTSIASAPPAPPTPTPAATASQSHERPANRLGDKVAATPTDLVEAFKRCGRFDAIRTELLNSFMASRSGQRFNERVEDIINKKLDEAETSHNPSNTISTTTTAGGSGRPAVPVPVPLASMRNSQKEEMMRELERHTAYERADQDLVQHVLPKHTAHIEDELKILLVKIGRPAPLPRPPSPSLLPQPGDRPAGPSYKGSELGESMGMDVDRPAPA